MVATVSTEHSNDEKSICKIRVEFSSLRLLVRTLWLLSMLSSCLGMDSGQRRREEETLTSLKISFRERREMTVPRRNFRIVFFFRIRYSEWKRTSRPKLSSETKRRRQRRRRKHADSQAAKCIFMRSGDDQWCYEFFLRITCLESSYMCYFSFSTIYWYC